MFPENKKMKDSPSSFELNIVRPLSLKKRAGKPKRNIFQRKDRRLYFVVFANNGMELCCNEHENVDQVYLIGEEEENDNELNSNSISKNHLDKLCNLIPIKQVIPLEIVMSEQIETLQNMVKDLQSQIQKLQIVENKKQIKKMKENNNKQIEELNVNKKMNNVKADVLKKDKQIIGLTNDIQQLKTKMNQLLMI
ncbi:hypothetical protein RFI_21977 [Reticulomyxa filosa]|uniref:Viral A-type inclusion protein n=1 Tax=Reticulomyxa filosa TaxID=46433 RepID=X6MPQ9_RETFI|nr:hypothetical protein RFI_21977 [Reticulomyxa filosa]|eukprot:ETO15387.1 hypothetical protein RFI_21977 [Reticulomyxa filosa]